MLNYIIRRILLMFPTLLGITLLVFMVMAYAPGGVGGPVLNEAGNMKSQEAQRLREYYNKRYGLDKPPIIQYARWINQILPIGFRKVDNNSISDFGFKWPDLGESLARHRPVTELVRESLPITVLLNAVCIPLVYAVGILSGLFAAQYRGKWFDVSSGFVFLALWSIPAIWAGVMLIGFLANRSYFNLFPTSGLHETMADQMLFLPSGWGPTFQRGWLLDTLWHLVLPLICLTYGGFAYLSKLVRGSVLDNLHADFVRTARAKGVAPRDILFRHVFRNSLLAFITVAAGIIPSLLGGSIVVESIFSIPGMGRLGVEAVQMRDRELVLAVTLVGGCIGLLCDILRDVWYALADPRVSYE
ncbi:MAG: ABC transporter permease [Planctomycetota bacterium]|nr:ABC transporter permease [Planctomycetota bacterium]